MAKTTQNNRWYPVVDQVKDPGAVHRTLKQVLDQLYDLQDQHTALQASHAALQAKVGKAATATANGPATTKLLGLNVEPVDVQTLANGATLKWNSSKGTFSFQ